MKSKKSGHIQDEPKKELHLKDVCDYEYIDTPQGEAISISIYSDKLIKRGVTSRLFGNIDLDEYDIIIPDRALNAPVYIKVKEMQEGKEQLLNVILTKVFSRRD